MLSSTARERNSVLCESNLLPDITLYRQTNAKASIQTEKNSLGRSCNFFFPPTVDITVYHNGYHGDLNETFFVGEVDEGAKKLVQTTYECLMQAIDSGEDKNDCKQHIPCYMNFKLLLVEYIC